MLNLINQKHIFWNDSLDDVYLTIDGNTVCFDSLGDEKFSINGEILNIDGNDNLLLRSGNKIKKFSHRAWFHLKKFDNRCER